MDEEIRENHIKLDKLQVKFSYNKKKTYVWQGIKEKEVKVVSKKAKEHIHEQLIMMLCSQEKTHIVDQQEISSHIPPAISEVLQQFPVVACTKPSLPPKRIQDHKIPLVPGAKPLYLKPYWQSHHIKNELKKIIKDLL